MVLRVFVPSETEAHIVIIYGAGTWRELSQTESNISICGVIANTGISVVKPALELIHEDFSSASRNQPLTQAFYNSSNVAVRHLRQALAAEWADKHIRVNTVSPGHVETDQTKHMDKKILQHSRKTSPPIRSGQPFPFLSRENRVLTRACLLHDGRRLHRRRWPARLVNRSLRAVIDGRQRKECIFSV
ncbi:hypothetical protein V8E55_002648 [Tylopilus felleus]